MTIRYTPKSLEDLKEIQGYIEEVLYNQIAAKKIIGKIIKTCTFLKQQPYMGQLLEEKIGCPSEMRYVISDRYIIIYKIEKEYISIIRILDTRTNYMNILF